MEPQFTEDWFPMWKQRGLQAAMRSVTAKDGDVIEVGSWEGKSTIQIANHFFPAVIKVIDHWLGDLTNPESGVADLAAQRDVFGTFTDNMEVATKGNYEVHRMDWRSFKWVGGDPVRFIFIDGEHTYEQVADNINAVAPLLVPGGVIAGDDFNHPPVLKAVTDNIPKGMALITFGDIWWYHR